MAGLFASVASIFQPGTYPTNIFQLGTYPRNISFQCWYISWDLGRKTEPLRDLCGEDYPLTLSHKLVISSQSDSPAALPCVHPQRYTMELGEKPSEHFPLGLDPSDPLNTEYGTYELQNSTISGELTSHVDEA